MSPSMMLNLLAVSLLVQLAAAFRRPFFTVSSHVGRRHGLRSCSMHTDGWVALPVDPSAGEYSRKVPFSPSALEDIHRVEQILAQDKGAEACAVVIPSWRHHLVQYDHLSAAFEALNIFTTVSPLPDGLWALLLQRLKVHTLRRAARKGVLKLTITDAIAPLFTRLDLILRRHSDRNHGRRLVVIASDDSAWLVRAFVNSRSTQWLSEVPLQSAVFVGGYHKSIVGQLALDVFPHRPRNIPGTKGGLQEEGARAVKFFNLNGGEGGRIEIDRETSGLEPSISCLSLEEDSESCVLQEYEVEDRRWLSLLGSTSLLGLWVPRVFGR